MDISFIVIKKTDYEKNKIFKPFDYYNNYNDCFFYKYL